MNSNRVFPEGILPCLFQTGPDISQQRFEAGDITSEAISTALSEQVDAPSFLGHPSTCDGEQMAGLPALCSPQQVLGELHDGELTSLGGWIDVGAIYPGD